MSISDILNKRRSGASTFEWTLTLPFTIIIIGFMFYLMFMLLSWASYGTLASNIAKDLNMRTVGLSEALNWSNARGSNSVIASGYGTVITTDQITVEGEKSGTTLENAYKAVVAYEFANHNKYGIVNNDYANQVFFPYTKFENIDLSFRRAGAGTSYSSAKTLNNYTTLSNYLVKVQIIYEFMPFSFFGNYIQIPGLTVVTAGYGVIS